MTFKSRSLAGLLGALLLAGFIWWSVSIFKDAEVTNWWVIATGYGAMMGLYLIMWSLGVYERAAPSGDGGKMQVTG